MFILDYNYGLLLFSYFLITVTSFALLEREKIISNFFSFRFFHIDLNVLRALYRHQHKPVVRFPTACSFAQLMFQRATYATFYLNKIVGKVNNTQDLSILFHRWKINILSSLSFSWFVYRFNSLMMCIRRIHFFWLALKYETFLAVDWHRFRTYTRLMATVSYKCIFQNWIAAFHIMITLKGLTMLWIFEMSCPW